MPAGASGSITVWVDAVRLPVAKLYAKTHPKVHLKIVTYDGDGNGATTMQTKIQLWNRTGHGWPDVIFSEQANDPVWMGQKPFDYALDLKTAVPSKLRKGWPSPSLAQCTVNGRLVCLQDNLAQEVLYVNQKLMKQFGYQVPTTWQQWAALGQKVAAQHPGYIIGNIGDSYGAWLYLWADKCPISQVIGPNTVRINEADVHCTRMANLLDPLIKSGVVPPESVFTADFATKWGGDSDKILLMPGPVWYAKDIFSGTLHVPAGELTAALPLRWGSEPLVTGQVGGGPWIVSKHSKNVAAAVDFVKWATTSFAVKGKVGALSPGYPSYGPSGDEMVEVPEQGQLLRRPGGTGDAGGREPHLEGLEHGHLSRPAGLVELGGHAARRGQVVELAAAGARHRARAERAGGGLQGRSEVERAWLRLL